MLSDSSTRQAFEVEDIRNRLNYMFVYEPTTKSLDMFNTSLNVGRVLDMTYREDPQIGCLMPHYWLGGDPGRLQLNPLGCETAFSYFKALYEKSLKDHQICFLGWVDPDTVELIYEEAENEK